MTLQEKHKTLTESRKVAFAELFGCSPSAVFTPESLFKKPDNSFLIDILVYTLTTESGDIEVAVTNGMSDRRMAEADYPHEYCRRELIQYLPKCTQAHARRLHDMAWLPLFDGFHLDSHHSVVWTEPAIAGTPWKNAFFLMPLLNSHRKFIFEIEGDQVAFLWHIPISDKERSFKLEHGADALIDRMEAVNLPWVFDETNRPLLLES